MVWVMALGRHFVTSVSQAFHMHSIRDVPIIGSVTILADDMLFFVISV